MSITLNKHYKFQFDPTRDADALNGIYRVDRVLGYNSVVLEEIDIYTSLYKRIGKSEADLEVDLTNYLDDLFYKMTSMFDQSVVWVPESLIVGYPDPNVREYSRVMLTTDLGVYEDPDTLYHITRIVKDNLKHMLGLVAEDSEEPIDARINPHTAVAEYNTVWMSDAEYKDVENLRATKRVVDDNMIDYYEKWKERGDEVKRLQEQITALEEALTGVA